MFTSPQTHSLKLSIVRSLFLVTVGVLGCVAPWWLGLCGAVVGIVVWRMYALVCVGAILDGLYSVHTVTGMPPLFFTATLLVVASFAWYLRTRFLICARHS